jgi:hypothetical protein
MITGIGIPTSHSRMPRMPETSRQMEDGGRTAGRLFRFRMTSARRARYC